MNTHLLTGLIAALGLMANIAGVGEARAQDGHTAHGAHSHAHADFTSERLHVRVDGPEDGRDIILIPGLSSSPRIWQATVDHLAQSSLPGGWRVHRIHVQGFAGAEPKANATGPVAAPVAEEIARYISEQGLDKPVVVGHSMGGTIGMMLAARHPEAVGRLMVVDMIPFMGAMFGPPGTTAESVIPVADQVYAAQSTAERETYLTQARVTVSGMVATESQRAVPLADVEASNQQVSASAYRELITTDLRPELSKIAAPTEVVYVKFNDARMTNEVTDMIYQMSFATLAGVKLKRIDDAAHFVFLDQPAAFHAELDAFVAQ